MLIYGDSLTVLSESIVQFFYSGSWNIVFAAYPGTSVCDWAPFASTHKALYKPQQVVLAFTGNTRPCCSGPYGIPGFLSAYETSVRRFHSVFAGLPIKLLGSPAMNDTDPTRPHTNGLPELNALYQSLSKGGAKALSGVYYDSAADDWLTPGHVWRVSGPQFPGVTPNVPLRTSDGIHLTTAGQAWYGVAIGR